VHVVSTAPNDAADDTSTTDNLTASVAQEVLPTGSEPTTSPTVATLEETNTDTPLSVYPVAEVKK